MRKKEAETSLKSEKGRMKKVRWKRERDRNYVRGMQRALTFNGRLEVETQNKPSKVHNWAWKGKRKWKKQEKYLTKKIASYNEWDNELFLWMRRKWRRLWECVHLLLVVVYVWACVFVCVSLNFARFIHAKLIDDGNSTGYRCRWTSLKKSLDSINEWSGHLKWNY